MSIHEREEPPKKPEKNQDSDTRKDTKVSSRNILNLIKQFGKRIYDEILITAEESAKYQRPPTG